MLAAQSHYGPHRSGVVDVNDVCLGGCLYRSLPEDAFDCQPLNASGMFHLVADVRIDDRSDVGSMLAIPTRELSEMSDSEILFRALLRWGEEAPRRVRGDYAFAFFQRASRTLLLCRDTAGEKPLHYFASPKLFAFASMPQALASTIPGRGDVDSYRLARFVAGLPNRGCDSFHESIKRLEPGHVLRLTPAGAQVVRYWSALNSAQQMPSRDLGEALCEQLDAAVARRLRRSGGGVATHLSSGLDSSAVTTSAAAQLRTSVFAFTAGPRLGFNEDVPGKIADETAMAATTAKLHENIVHAVVRPTAGPLEWLNWSHSLAGQPVGSLFNHVWWQQINASAAAANATILLTGEVGNFGLSAGGVAYLVEFMRAGRWAAWWNESSRLAKGSHAWRNVLSASFGGYIPKGLHDRFSRHKGFWHPEFLAGDWRARVAREWDDRSAIDPRQQRWRHLQMADPGTFRKMALARWGIQERDPTADRRLLEFCFSLPAEALLHQGVDRPALRHVLQGRVSDQVLASRLRGLQSADWHRAVTPVAIRDFLANVGDQHIVDQGAVSRALAEWPERNPPALPAVRRFSISLMRAVSAMHFAETVSAA